MRTEIQNYKLNRPKLIKAYVDNMCEYLHLKYPHMDEAAIRHFVDNTVKKNIARPKVQLITHPNYGDAKLADVDLLTYTNNMGERIITPSGSVYMTPDEKPSLMKLKIIDNIKQRKVVKAVMLEAAGRGDLVTEQSANYKQGSIKIVTNSISGAMANAYNCLFDIPGYNAITSVGRYSVMSAYARVEQILEGNFYFPDLNSVINYCVQLHRVIPSNIMQLVQKYNLYIPSVQDLYNHILESTKFYMREINISVQLKEFLNSLPEATRIFVFYASCFKTLVHSNEITMRNFFKTFFDISNITIDPSIDPNKIFKIEEELLAMVLSLNSVIIEHKKLDEAIELFPDGVRKLIAIAHYMEKHLDDISDLITAFFAVEMDTPDPMSHFNMIRKAVIVSDTDSVILSTQSMVVWYTGSVTFDKASAEINAFTFYLISSILKHVFARVSVGLGVTGEDISRIAMKNEFLYPLFFRTQAKKHYAGLITVQEGNVLPKPKLDIKGLELRGSTICVETRDAVEKFIRWLLDTVVKEGSTTARECISKVVEHETLVYNSILSGEKTFLTTASVKPANEYVNAGSSNYFYYEMWQEVFADKFGSFVIPNKGYSFSILNEGQAIRSETYLDYVLKHDKKIHKRLVAFLEKHPKRKLNTVIIPPIIIRTPDILRPLIDLRKIIYANGKPFYLLLKSLGISLTDSDQMLLCSDFYDIKGVEIPM